MSTIHKSIRATRPEPPPHVSADAEIAATPIPKWAIGEFFGTHHRPISGELLGGGIYRFFFGVAYRA